MLWLCTTPIQGVRYLQLAPFIAQAVRATYIATTDPYISLLSGNVHGFVQVLYRVHDAKGGVGVSERVCWETVVLCVCTQG